MSTNHGEGAGGERPTPQETLSVSHFASLYSPPVAGTLAWPDAFSEFHEVEEGGKAGVPLWSPALFEGARALSNVRSLGALVLDYDAKGGALDPASILSVWREYECVLHSTYTPGSWRLVLPYDRRVSAAEHAAVWAWAKKRDGRIDGACKDASRMYFLPTCRADLDTSPQYGYNEGERLVVDRLPVDLRPGPSGRSHFSPSSSSPRASQPTAGSALGGSAYSGIEEVVRQREDLALIEERCAFMRHAREDATDLPEPEWYAALTVVARCRDGDDLAHEISKPYHGYSWSETQMKLERAKAVGPATCAHVRNISSACEGCPLSVTSPILLGRNDAVVEEESNADPQDVLREAREAYDRARQVEDAARVAVEQAKRTLRAVRAPRSGASDDDLDAAVRGVGAAREELRVAERARGQAERVVAKAAAKASLSGLPAGADPRVWGRLQIQQDRPVASLANVLTVLAEDPKWSSRLSYDLFSQEVCLDREPLAEEKATEITAQLAYDYSLNTVTATVTECVRAVARRRPFHPVREWLSTLTWDGSSRVRELMFEGFGAAPSSDDELVALLGERFLLSLIARVMRPGAKVDTMLVLVGRQGAHKSTSLEALVGEMWFGSTKLDLTNKDSFLQLRGKWLYEIGEMEGIKRADAAVSKQWLSNKVDTYRAPYAKRAEDHRRQTVVAGTTNEDEILLDPTGYRRYWPVRVEKAKLAWIYDHRNQLFAEALALYNQGAVWWFDEGSEEGERLRRYTMPYQQVHPWTEVIYDWIAQHAGDKAFTVGQVLQRALGRLTSDLTQHEAALVGTILRHHIGCTSERSMVGGRKVTMYHRPPNMVLPNSKKNNLIALSRQQP